MWMGHSRRHEQDEKTFREARIYVGIHVSIFRKYYLNVSKNGSYWLYTDSIVATAHN